MINTLYDQVVLDQLTNQVPSLTVAPTENSNPIRLCFDELAEASTFIRVWWKFNLKKFRLIIDASRI